MENTMILKIVYRHDVVKKFKRNTRKELMAILKREQNNSDFRDWHCYEVKSKKLDLFPYLKPMRFTI